MVLKRSGLFGLDGCSKVVTFVVARFSSSGLQLVW